MEEETGIGLAQHGGVVEGISGGDDAVVQRLEGGHGLLLLIGLAQLVVHDAAVRGHIQLVAEDGGPRQLAHQRLGKFSKSVAQNDDLRDGAQLIEKGLRPLQRSQRADDLLDVRQLEAVCVQDFEAALHEHIVVGLLPRGAAQFGDASFFGKGDPDFRDENAFKIEGDDGLLLHAGVRNVMHGALAQ